MSFGDYEFKRSIILTFTGLLLGLIVFFESERLSTLVLNSSILSIYLGLSGFISENFTRLKTFIGLLILSGLFFIFLVFPAQSFCDAHSIPNVDAGKNIFTGEVEIKTYSGDPDCSNLLPWYYKSLENDTERDILIEDYCLENKEDRYCKFDEAVGRFP